MHGSVPQTPHAVPADPRPSKQPEVTRSGIGTRTGQMIDGIQLYLVAATALGNGSMGAALYVFLWFVMEGLKRLPSEQGIAAMQSPAT